MHRNGADIEGVQVLLSTPMHDDGSLDFESMHRLVDHVITGGVHGIILLGSTGEFFSLSETERKSFAERAIEYIAGRVPVGVCPGTSGTETTVELARHASDCGADYLLVPIPFYFTNTQSGIVDYYDRVAKAVPIGIMPYDGGGGHTIDAETWRRIALNNENVNLAKITVPSPPKISWLHQEFAGKVRSFGGSDQTVLLSLANGARGLTVAGANVVPQPFVETFRLYRLGDENRHKARLIYHEKISPMNEIAVPAHTEFIQCYKQALYWMGIIRSPHTRGPMMPLDAPRKEELWAALQMMGVALPCASAASQN